MLHAVTFTGADDSVDPRALLDISMAYPFVEWGILFSKHHQGRHRFPTLEWVEALVGVAEDSPGKGMSLSAHLCGTWCRDIARDARPTWWQEFQEHDWPDAFDRVQLNFHGEYQHFHPSTPSVLRDFEQSVILQCDDVNDEGVRQIVNLDQEKFMPLFDTSSGCGVLPESWPEPWPNAYCGFAGGLGPDTIDAQLLVIHACAAGADYWIDMERRVRSDDDSAFDLVKVQRVLDTITRIMPVHA